MVRSWNNGMSCMSFYILKSLACLRTFHRVYLFMYISITKPYLYYNYEKYSLWNRGVWRFFHDTYLTIEVQGIRCTNRLHDSCPFTDVHPHFTAPGCRYYFKFNSWWPIVTSSTHGPAASYCDVTMAHCSHGYLWTHDVEVSASWRDCDNLWSPELFGTCLHHFAYRGRIIHYSTLGDQTIYTRFGVNLFVYFTYHFRTPVFQQGASLVHFINNIILTYICHCVYFVPSISYWILLSSQYFAGDSFDAAYENEFSPANRRWQNSIRNMIWNR